MKKNEYKEHILNIQVTTRKIVTQNPTRIFSHTEHPLQFGLIKFFMNEETLSML